MTDALIRFLSPDDAAALWQLRLEALQEETHAFGSSAEDHLQLTIEDFCSRLTADPADYFVAGVFAADQLVGAGWFVRAARRKESHKGRIQGVYLAAQMRGRGLGRRLLEALLERAARLPDIEQITLSVVCSQPAASALYRSLGFVSYGHEVNALKVEGKYLDEEHMVLWLTGSRWRK